MVLILAAIAAILMLKNAANDAKARLLNKECGNQMIRLSFASMIFLQQFETENYPMEFSQMFDVMGSPEGLFCPADERGSLGNWALYQPGIATYEIVSPGISFTNTNAVFVRCPLHGHVIRADGIVYDNLGVRLKRGAW